MKVIVTGAGALLGQGIIRSLLRSSLRELQVVAVDPDARAAGLYWAAERYLVPSAANPGYITSIERLLEKTAADVLIPGTDVELPLFARNRERLEERFPAKILVSSADVVEIADDKFQTFEFFKSHGFAAPLSCLPGQEEKLFKETDFPLIVKPRRGARSVGLRQVKNRAELDAAIAATVDPIIQECVGCEESEYTAGTVLFNGDCASIVMRRELRDGNTYRAEVDLDPSLRRQVEEFARALKACGPANFQFRMVDGVAKVFEINARFSGTTPLRMLAGFNEVEICIRYLLQGVRVGQPALRPITALRHWEETILEPGTAPPAAV